MKRDLAALRVCASVALECGMSAFITSAAGVRIPRIIYGTAWKKADTERLVTLAIQQGFRGIDTACQPKHYNEAGVGAGVRACLNAGLARGDLYLQTKFTSVSGHDPSRIPYDPTASLPEQVAQSFAASLRNLQTDYVDCLVLHSPLPTPRQTLQVWRAIESLVDSGGVRQVGISNCYALAELEDLYRSARIKPAVVQNRFYAETGYDRELRAFCKEHEIIYQSFWTLTANPQVLAHATITALASTHKRTAAQILLRHLTQSGVVPLTGTKSETHMRQDLSIFDFDLTDPERGAVDTLFAG
jgi:diketogulonate reductase-like aldo/keto reductase